MPFLSNKRQLFAVEETTAGTPIAKASAAVAGTGKFQVYDATWSPTTNINEREHQKRHLGNVTSVVGSKSATISFSLDLRRTNATHSADTWGLLLTACGMKATADSGVNIIYAPTSVATDVGPNEQKTLTMGLNVDGIVYWIYGAMGNVTITGTVGEPCRMNFEFTGCQADSSTIALAGIAHETGDVEAFLGTAMSYDAASAGDISANIVYNSFTFDLGNEVQLRPDVAASVTTPEGTGSHKCGYKAAIITGRNPTWVFDPEVIALSASADFLKHLNAGSTVALSCAVESNITIAAPKAQVTALSHEERNGVAAYGVTLACRENIDDGDDAITITKT